MNDSELRQFLKILKDLYLNINVNQYSGYY
jgi:hypothetical protein